MQSSSLDGVSNIPSFKNYGFFGLDFEGSMQFAGPFEFVGGVRYLIGASNIQYNYTNKDSPSDKGTAKNLSALSLMLDFRLGIRWHFVRFGRLSFFASGGAVAGTLNFNYNEEEYRAQNGNTLGFKSAGEASGYWGYYGDCGMQIIGKQLGFRFFYRYSDVLTGAYETIANTRFPLIQKQIGFLIFSKI